MNEPQLYTSYDMVEYLEHYGSMDPQKLTVEDCRRAVVNAYREWNNSHNWSFLMARGRINTVAPYGTGTIQYDEASRQMTLTGGTWPAWAAFGVVLLNAIPYQVASRVSDTVIVMEQRGTIGGDLDAGTTYSLYRDVYPFPADYRAGYNMVEYITGYQAVYTTMNNYLFAGRNRTTGMGKPSVFAVGSDPNYLGSMAAFFHPVPDNAYAFEFVYQRRPRPLVVHDYVALIPGQTGKTGTVSCVSGLATITGVSTAWNSRMVGSVIRIGEAGESNPPTSLTGAYPYAYERVVISVDSATQVTVDAVLPETLTAVKHRVSDPIDVEEGAGLTSFHRECEKQIRLIKRMRPLTEGDTSETQEWQLAYLRAREADKRDLSPQVAGGPTAARRRMIDMPLSWTDGT